MAWTEPRTYTTGELITAAILNTHIRDNFNVVNPSGISLVLDKGGDPLTAGSQMYFEAPFDFGVARWTAATPEASSLEVEFYAVSFGGFPAASEDSINSGSPAKTASALTGQDTNPSAFGTVTKGELVTVQVTGASGITHALISLLLDRQ